MADFAQYEPIPIHGEPGVGIVGTNRYQVGVQSDSPDMAAWAARQPNLDRAKATEEANRVAKEGLYLDHLMLNQRTTASARQVEAAITFQAMRNYERDLSTAKAAGLSEEQAALQALVRNPRVLSGAGFGPGVRALQPPPTPTVHNLPGVKTPFVQMGNTGRFAPADDTGYMPNVVDVEGAGKVLRTGPKSAQLLKGGAKLTPTQLMSRAKQLTDSLPIGGKASPAVQEQLDEIDRQLKELTMPSAPAAQPTGKAIRVRNKSNGKIRPYYGNASDVPLDHYEILP